MPNPPDQRDRRGGTVRAPIEREDSVPIDADTPMGELITRTKRATHQAESANIGVVALREELHDYANRDVEEHAELRGVMAKFDERQHESNRHMGDVRVAMAVVATKLDTFVGVVQTQLADKEKTKDAERVEGQSKRDHKRHLFVAIVGLVAGIIGALVHWAFR